MPATTARISLFALFVIVAGFAVACSDGAQSSKASRDGLAPASDNFTANDGRLKVATTVAPITSIVLNIGGSRIRVHGVVPDGVDSHTFEPKPSDAKLLARADMLIMNGAHLEGTTEQIARENLRDPSKIYALADNTISGDDPRTGFLYDFSFPRSGGDPNPHLWMNPPYALKFAELIKGWLSANDAKNADYYQANFDRYSAVLKQLDAAIEQDHQTVPAENRKLLTYHDSWAYWARRYGWQVIGAIQPSDFKEPSAREVADLINQIKGERVPAIFGSEVFPSTTLQTIARESGAQFEDRLRDDEPPGAVADAKHTYVGMVVEDMQILFTRLGGRADNVSKVPVANSYLD